MRRFSFCLLLLDNEKATTNKKEKGNIVDSKVLERINDGSATIDDYAEFFAAFGVTLYKADGTYKTVGEVFKEANEKLRGS